MLWTGRGTFKHRKMKIRTVYPTKAQPGKLLFKWRLINSFPPPHSPHPAATATTFGLYALYQCRSLRKVKISLTQIYQEFPVPCYTKTPQTAVLRPRNLRGSAGTERMKPTNSSLVHQNWRCHHQTWGWERRGEELVKEKTRRGWGGEKNSDGFNTVAEKKIVSLLRHSWWHCSACFQSRSHTGRPSLCSALQQQELNPFPANMATNPQTGCLSCWGKLKGELKQVTW